MIFKISSNSEYRKEVRNRRVLGPEALELGGVKDRFCVGDFMGGIEGMELLSQVHERPLLLL